MVGLVASGIREYAINIWQCKTLHIIIYLQRCAHSEILGQIGLGLDSLTLFQNSLTLVELSRYQIRYFSDLDLHFTLRDIKKKWAVVPSYPPTIGEPVQTVFKTENTSSTFGNLLQESLHQYHYFLTNKRRTSCTVCSTSITEQSNGTRILPA